MRQEEIQGKRDRVKSAQSSKGVQRTSMDQPLRKPRSLDTMRSWDSETRLQFGVLPKIWLAVERELTLITLFSTHLERDLKSSNDLWLRILAFLQEFWK